MQADNKKLKNNHFKARIKRFNKYYVVEFGREIVHCFPSQ
ncbi:hypothetical protein ASZ90_007745 [hydrocarbon metagenome]|uniref:Uncharacterized protein n=1 Tax=hydrocarbon metagenome TaxID=938273 RepID=A0A0W8FPB8_9ZZZZ